MVEDRVSCGNTDQCSGSSVRHHVPRHRPGVSLSVTSSGGGAGFVRKVYFPANEPAVFDHNATRMNIAHEPRAIADIDLVCAVDISLQRTEYINFFSLDAGAHF